MFHSGPVLRPLVALPLMHKLVPSLAVAAALLTASAAHSQSLRGSRASIERMHRQAVQHDVQFYSTSAAVRKAAGAGKLVRLTGSGDYRLGSVSQPYLLPAGLVFVERLAAQYRARCGEPLVVTSAVRPTSQRLANGSSRSVHPTGMAVDLRKPRSGRCLSWLRETLSALEAEGVIEATEEHRPPHFHVAVFPTPYTRYAGGRGGEPRLAEAPRSKAGAGADGTGRTYRVRRGESLWTIARNNRVSVDVLKDANALRSSRIVAGQLLQIPGGD